MYRYVLFDLDGTITDSAPGILNSIDNAFQKFGIKGNRSEMAGQFIGGPLVEMLEEHYGFTHDDALKGLQYFREYFEVRGMFENDLYDGIYTVLETLKSRGQKVILATAKPEQYAVQILEHFDIAKYFDEIAGSTMNEERSLKSQVIEYALEKLDITDRSEAVMVGDRHYDIEGAKMFGLDSVGSLYGYGSLEELRKAGATYIAEKPEDILKYV